MSHALDQKQATLHRRSLLAALGATIAAPAFAQPPRPPAPAAIGLMSGELGGTFVRIAADLTSVVDPAYLRVVPLFGKGSVQNIGDLIQLPGVDMALVAADALPYVRKQGLYPNAIDRIQYICKLYDQDLHVCAGPDIKTLTDLDGKPVNIDVDGSGTDLTARTVFGALGIKPDFRNRTPAAGMADLTAGTIEANVYCIGAPGTLFTAVPAGTNLHLVPVPSNAEIEQTYVPGTFTHAQYPTLIPEGQEVSTVGVGVALANFGWAPNTARYRHLALFVGEFFSGFSELLKPPHHPVWHDVNLAASLPGWTRFQPAMEWLKQQADEAALGRVADKNGLHLTPQQQADLFRQYREWSAAHGR